MIAQQLPGRTDNDVKNYWNSKLRKKLAEMGIDPITHKPFSKIFADYGNVGGLSKAGMRISSLNKDLKNAILMKTEPKGLLNASNHFIPFPSATTTMTISPKKELTQDSFLLNDNNILSNDKSLNLLSQLQAIMLVTEASNYVPNYESPLPSFNSEATFSSPSLSSSSSSSSSCSSGAEEMLPLAFNWNDFLLEDAFLPNEAQENETKVEFISSQDLIITDSQIQSEEAKDMDNTLISSIGAINETTSSESSFVETLLARENEMLLEFPDLLAESFY